jgi:hypothetical protein
MVDEAKPHDIRGFLPVFGRVPQLWNLAEGTTHAWLMKIWP